MSALILVIEDEVTIRENIVDILEIDGFDVRQAENGGAGLGMLQWLTPELIICDVNMPDFDGFQVLQHVRKKESLAKIPFLFVTAQVDRKSMRQGMELGADDYLTKPFTHEELLSAVYARLRRQETMLNINQDELNKAKKNLTQLVAHELRTPLSSVVMIEKFINQRIDSLSKDQVAELLDSWKSGAHRLHHLVEQMVLMTKIDTDALTMYDVRNEGELREANDLLKKAVGIARQFAHRYPHGTIMVKPTKEHYPIKCHAQSLTHALAEIISNALDFSPEGSAVQIAVGKYEYKNRQKQYVRYNIVDMGTGMTTRRLERALLPFEQVDRNKHEQQGMGLGLPLAKKIVEIHEGDIVIRQAAAGGTQVVIQLPLHSH